MISISIKIFSMVNQVERVFGELSTVERGRRMETKNSDMLDTLNAHVVEVFRDFCILLVGLLSKRQSDPEFSATGHLGTDFLHNNNNNRDITNMEPEIPLKIAATGKVTRS